MYKFQFETILDDTVDPNAVILLIYSIKMVSECLMVSIGSTYLKMTGMPTDVDMLKAIIHAYEETYPSTTSVLTVE